MIENNISQRFQLIFRVILIFIARSKISLKLIKRHKDEITIAKFIALESLDFLAKSIAKIIN